MQTENEDGQLSLFVQDGLCGRTSLDVSQAGSRPARTSASSCNRSRELVSIPYLSLDLTPGNGNLLGEFYWEILSPWLGGSLTLNTGPCPREDRECTLSQILQAGVPTKYYLTKRACLGILRKAAIRDKPLPPQLETALRLQAGLITVDSLPKPPLAFHINPREETIDLGETAGALLATVNMQMQTFISQAQYIAGFCAGAGSKAGGIGYTEELAPTLKASPSGNMMPSVLCLNDQGGKLMDISEGCTGTLRAQEYGHQLLIFDNHGQDCRWAGPLNVSPAICAGAGEGGNNLPFALEQNVVGALCARDHKGADNIYAEQNKLVVEGPLFIRRLIPLECELLQGYPPGWTDLVGASDTSRYKALGNSTAVPCAEFILGGIAEYAEREVTNG